MDMIRYRESDALGKFNFDFACGCKTDRRHFSGGAWRDLKLRRVGMDVPVALGVGCLLPVVGQR